MTEYYRGETGREIESRFSEALVLAGSDLLMSSIAGGAAGRPGYVALSSSILASKSDFARKGLWTPDDPSTPPPSPRGPGRSMRTLKIAPSAGLTELSVVAYSVGGIAVKSDR